MQTKRLAELQFALEALRRCSAAAFHLLGPPHGPTADAPNAGFATRSVDADPADGRVRGEVPLPLIS